VVFLKCSRFRKNKNYGGHWGESNAVLHAQKKLRLPRLSRFCWIGPSMPTEMLIVEAGRAWLNLTGE
jgi:hypothetical protein